LRYLGNESLGGLEIYFGKAAELFVPADSLK